MADALFIEHFKGTEEDFKAVQILITEIRSLRPESPVYFRECDFKGDRPGTLSDLVKAMRVIWE